MEQIDPQEIAKFVELRSHAGGLSFFGSDPRDYGRDKKRWFQENSWRFLIPIDAIKAARRPVDVDQTQGVCGVYFLFLESELQYVGQSKHIQYRVTQHLYSMRPIMPIANWFDSITAIWVPRDFLDLVESHYINSLKPPRNAVIRPTHHRMNALMQPAKPRRKKYAMPLNMERFVYDPEAIARKLDQ
jgi:hypothetical protein